ncbi:MAG: hypothetical protein Q4D17_06425 [Planctomycetia bacterium]|nr:hypothetical protein [Planctomycetia bacterium]
MERIESNQWEELKFGKGIAIHQTPGNVIRIRHFGCLGAAVQAAVNRVRASVR